MQTEKKSDIPTSKNPEIIGRKELSTRLGVHPLTVLRYEKLGLIQGFRLGGTAKYDWNEVFAKLKQNPGYRGRR